MALNIFKPHVSVVSKGIEGKTLLVYGTNRTGKTLQLTRLPKPCYLAFEKGDNAINGLNGFPMPRWSEFITFVKQATDENKIKDVQELYQTIIIDQLEAVALLCEKYILMKFGVNSLGEKRVLSDGKIDFGFNGYRELGKEFEFQLRALTSVGYTVAFVAHEGTRTLTDEDGKEYTKIYPKGDKRIVDPVCDLVDIIGFVSPNGVDENGIEILSSMYLRQTRKYHAGSRFKYMTPVIKEFTAENLITAIADAVEAEEKASGIKAVTFEQQAATQKVDDLPSYETIKNQITDLALAIYNFDDKHSHYAAAQTIIEKHLGKGKTVSNDTTPEQVELLCVIYDDLHAFVEYDPQLCKLLQIVENQ